MTYSVDWSSVARAQLASDWISNPGLRRAITAAQARIDRLLAANPRGAADSEAEGLFGLSVSPLRVQYEVSDADRLVEVVASRLVH